MRPHGDPPYLATQGLIKPLELPCTPLGTHCQGIWGFGSEEKERHCSPSCLLLWSERAELPGGTHKTQSLQKHDTAPSSHPDQ